MHVVVGALMLSLPLILWTIFGIKQIGWKFVVGFYAAVALCFAWMYVAISLLGGRSPW